MFGQTTPSEEKINIEEFRDKVLGCWTGKNIGGTLGAPMEGKREMTDVSFYVQELGGNPAPNDDLDLQLVWLRAIEDNGLYRVDERILGEYWLRFITGPWNEYGIGKFNMINGLFPPLSGLCNNGQWKNSNGAWIRSEVWACLSPARRTRSCASPGATPAATTAGTGFTRRSSPPCANPPPSSRATYASSSTSRSRGFPPIAAWPAA